MCFHWRLCADVGSSCVSLFSQPVIPFLFPASYRSWTVILINLECTHLQSTYCPITESNQTLSLPRLFPSSSHSLPLWIPFCFVPTLFLPSLSDLQLHCPAVHLVASTTAQMLAYYSHHAVAFSPGCSLPEREVIPWKSSARGRGRRRGEREGGNWWVSEKESEREEWESSTRPTDWRAPALEKQLLQRMSHTMPVMSVASSLTIVRHRECCACFSACVEPSGRKN